MAFTIIESKVAGSYTVNTPQPYSSESNWPSPAFIRKASFETEELRSFTFHTVLLNVAALIVV